MKKKIFAVVICLALVAGLVGARIVDVNGPDENGGLASITIGQKTLVIGPVSAQAAGTVDYTCDGTADDVQLQAALNALPAGGGMLSVLAGTYDFTNLTSVTRAIDNVTVGGVGLATYFTCDAVTPIFVAGGNNWVFSNFRTDAGGLDMGATTGWQWNNVNDGLVAYNLRTPDGSLVNGTFIASSLTDSGLTTGRVPYISVSGLITDEATLEYNTGTNTLAVDNLDAPTGRSATYVIAASDATNIWKAQADIVCDGTSDNLDVQAAVDAIVSDGHILLSPGNFYFSSPGVTVADKVIWIQGSGNQITQLSQSQNMTAMLTFNNTGIRTFSTVSDLLIRGNNTGGITTGIGIRTVGAFVYDFNVRNVFVTHMAGTGISIGAGGGWGGVFDNVIVEFCNGTQLDIAGGDSKIINCKFGGNSVAADVNLVRISSGCLVQACQFFAHAGTGVGMCPLLVLAGDNVITGNSFFNINSGNVGNTIITVTNTGNIISNNEFFACTASYGIQDDLFYATSNIITGNIYRACTFYNGFITPSTLGTTLVVSNKGYIARGERRFASGTLVPTGTCTATTVTGTFTESPLALKPGANTMHCTASGTISVVMPTGSTAIVTSGDAVVTGTPKTCPASATTVVTVATGAGADDFTITVHHDVFAWHDPEIQDIFITKVVINRTAAGGTATAEMNVGIADNGTVDDPGIEFFDSIPLNNAAAIHDSYVAGGTSYGTQTIWVNCQDSASATDGWVVGKLDTEIANSLAGRWYIEYCGK